MRTQASVIILSFSSLFFSFSLSHNEIPTEHLFFLLLGDKDLLFFRIPVPDGDEEPLVKVSRKEFERELLVVPRIVVVLDECRPAKRLLWTVGDQ